MFLFRRRFLVIVVLLVLLVFLFNLPPFSDSSFSKNLRRLGCLIFYPFEYSFSAAIDFTGGHLSDLLALRRAQEENKRLKQKIDLLGVKQQTLENLVGENRLLRQALGFSKHRLYGFKVIPAEVVVRPPALFFQSVMINKGASHGVKENMVVVTSKGLAGKVVEVFDFSSRVLLLIGAGQAVSVMDRDSGNFGVLQGTGKRFLRLKYVLNQASIAPGNLIVTSGLSEIYPPYIPVGRIKKVSKRDFDLFQNIKVKPLVDFSRLKYLFVLKQQ